MTRKIFRSILLVAGVVLAAGMVIMTGCLYSYFGGVQEQQLQDELSLAVSGVENGGTAYLERLPAERFRLTWIASDGRVLYDTQVTDVASMENHAGRQEVQEALENGSGESSRYSDTLLQQTLYVARRLTDGTVLRISVSRATAGMLALGMLQPMLVVLVAALILSVFGAWQWVDSKLNRSDWLTDTPNTPASTWLILGSDERDGSTDYGGVDNISGFRTDTILVLIKPKSGPSSLVSIPRDSLMNVDNQYMKINAVALIAGKKALVSNVEQITGQKIDHVAQIKFGGLQNVVNALGGIELCYDEDVQDSYSGLNWKAGCHTADGSTALSFSRMRYADARGDFGRNERQRQVISAIVKKASSSETLTNPSKIVAVSNAAMSALTVDEKTNPYTLLTMALAFKSATGSNGISGSVYWSDPDYYVDGVGSSVLLDDAKNTELFNQLADGTYKAGTVGNLAEG